ncbi:isopentenyl-diphosphate Delta-isomerase [Cellulomonas composti]
MTVEDHVVLLDDEGRASGAAPRAEVHGRHTPLHLAFSCYVLDDDGRVLVTRRAPTKRTWPGVWTNAFCGHPRPGEAPADAVRRRGREELGLELVELTLVLPSFRYRAVDDSGMVEHEECPVWFARAAGPVAADPDEVAQIQWVDAEDLGRAVTAAPWAFSPWLVAQVACLAELDERPTAVGA